MTMAQPSLQPLRRWDPERIGPYTVLGRLGAGAMGQVYLGRSMAGRLVAVKTIKIEFAEEAGFRTRFAHEVAAARRVSGVFTASVVAADADADVPWLATAYIPAPSLDRLVRACGPLPVQAVKWLAAGCAEALESIHSAGLVHRDLKPSNVLMSPDGPRVIDFGLARAAERIQLTVTHGAVGTPAYMAPEQARDTRQASVASDMFSLGATLLFAATSHPPYPGETVMDILVRLATEPPDLTGLPAELAGLITACLERSPRRRPTAAALLARLGQFTDVMSGSGSGHSYLTEPAIALIARYQRSPEPGRAQPADDTGDATLGSQHALRPAGYPPGQRGQLRPGDSTDGEGMTGPSLGGTGPPLGGTGPPRGTTGPLSGQTARRGKALTTVVLAGAAGALVAVGVVLGGFLIGPASPASPATGGSSAPASLPMGPPPPPPTALPTGTSLRPKVVLNQPFGDGNTGFVIHGSGWQPLTPVTVALPGHSVSPIRPIVDMVGTFNYVINQDHEFFARMIPPGTYRVVVTGSHGRRASVTFQVHPQPPPGAQPPPGVPPPSGSPPPSG